MPSTHAKIHSRSTSPRFPSYAQSYTLSLTSISNADANRNSQALCDAREPAWQMVVPPARLCTDNGVMVAWAAVERLNEGMSNHAEEQNVYARLPLGGVE